MPPMSIWLVTGTSRGLGLEFTRQILAGGDTVFATARNPATAAALHALHASAPAGRMHILPLDVSQEESVRAAAEAVEAVLQGRGLDYLVNNAAISFGADLPSTMKGVDVLETMRANVVGPLIVFQALLPALERSTRPAGAVVMNLTSGLASIGLDCGDKAASYSISKCALNMLTYKQAKEKPNIISFVLDPGWVKTALGGDGAQLEIPFSVGNQYKVITAATKCESGSFKRYNGEDIPW